MNSINISVLEGSGAGRSRTFDKQRLTFGRTPDNDIVIDVPQVSRRHGGLEYREGQWWAISVSPNGTTLNGKAIPEKKPQPIDDGDTVGVGKMALFTVQLPQAAAAEPAPPPDTTEEEEATSQTAQARKKKSALYIGIGVYVILTIVGAYIVKQMTGDPGSQTTQMPNQMPDERIREVIERPVRAMKSEVQKEMWMERARLAAAQRRGNPTQLWVAYDAYRKAVAASEDGRLGDPVAEREFDTVREELVQKVITQSRDAYAALGAQQYGTAERTLQNLIRTTYRDRNTPIGQYLQALLNYADRRTPS